MTSIGQDRCRSTEFWRGDTATAKQKAERTRKMLAGRGLKPKRKRAKKK